MASEGSSGAGLALRGLHNAQAGSVLFGRVPQEVRDKIYAEVFSSTLVVDSPTGAPSAGAAAGSRARPTSGVLSLLRTCRQARDEVGTTWLGQVLFSFLDAYTMVNKLAALPATTISQIRRVRLYSGALSLPLADGSAVYITLSSALSFLPGLQLDELTVLGGYLSILNGDTVNNLAKRGNGWKSLRYACPTSALFNVLAPRLDWPEEMRYVPVPDVDGWLGTLKRRDGAASKPTAAFYRCTRQRGSDKFRRTPAPPSADAELEKTVLVELTRGAGADYQVKEGAAVLETLRHQRHHSIPMTLKTWDGVRSFCVSDPGKVATKSHQLGIYDDIDEHSWVRVTVKKGVIKEMDGTDERGTFKL